MNLDGLKRWGQQRPLRPEVAAAMRNPAEYDPFSTNMSSSPLDEATSGLAASLKAMPDEIYFFGSGRLAHQIALAGALKGQANREVWASATSRSEILAGATRHLPVDRNGQAIFEATPSPTLLSRPLVNGESGAIDANAHPVEQHFDLSHAVGILDLPEYSLASLEAHAFGAPTLGIAVIKRDFRFAEPLPTADPKMPNLNASESLVFAAAKALASHIELAKSEYARLENFKSQVKQLCDELGDIDFVTPSNSVPHLISFSVLYAQGEELAREYERHGFQVESGSACAASRYEPSHVLVAMGRLTQGNVRLHVPFDATDKDLKEFLEITPAVIKKVREL